MPYTYNGRTIKEGRTWVDDQGVSHPYNWAYAWSDKEKADLGLVWHDGPKPYDNRFYWDADTPRVIDDVPAVDEDGKPVLDEDGNQIITRGLKWNAIQTVKAQARGLLTDTDWMVMRAFESGGTVPTEVAAYRQAVRDASNAIEKSIKAVRSHKAFMALYNTPVDAEGNPTGNAPINAWPDA